MRKLIYSILLFISINPFISCKKQAPYSTIVNTPPPPPPPTNNPPVANPGNTQFITLPANSVNLDGSASNDPDGTIVSYLWTKISGSSQYNLVAPTQAKTGVSNLVEGSYVFELTVTDNKGATAKNQVLITVEQPLGSCNMQLTPLGKLSLPRDGILAAAANNKVLFAGGYIQSAPGAGILQTRVDIYNTSSQTWTTAELSMGRYEMTAAVAGNKIFFAGGYTRVGNTFTVSTRVDIYDASTNTWSTSDLTVGRYGMATATIGNKVFFAGGNNDGYYDGENLDIVDIYDISSNAWSTARLSEPKGYLSATSLNSKIYFAGGINGNWYISDKVDVYDGSSNLWNAIYLQEPKVLPATIAADNTIFWAGGIKTYEQNSYPVYSDLVEMYNVNAGSRNFHKLSTARTCNAVIKSNKILFYTGEPLSNKVDIYDISTHLWSSCSTSQPSNVIVSSGNNVYVATVSANGVNQVWLLDF